ncbi:hypothetical protein DPEC_G00169090 [Dallia pectoralis]|uniref:Uncharacterized protein n=1 Tax=Dallia pectoralis TaxID=75939 RepID=A0ACC2GCT3_DALPE|nr:hypothetical protein DPEC_G00169090 [Dallia pectoralis]
MAGDFGHTWKKEDDEEMEEVGGLINSDGEDVSWDPSDLREGTVPPAGNGSHAASHSKAPVVWHKPKSRRRKKRGEQRLYHCSNCESPRYQKNHTVDDHPSTTKAFLR